MRGKGNWKHLEEDTGGGTKGGREVMIDVFLTGEGTGATTPVPLFLPGFQCAQETLIRLLHRPVDAKSCQLAI